VRRREKLYLLKLVQGSFLHGIIVGCNDPKSNHSMRIDRRTHEVLLFNMMIGIEQKF
jgi:hypothetical protein